MSSPAAKRSYDSSHRQARARANRLAVIEAARERFLTQGFAATTLAQVAEDAGVSQPTVYKGFRSKAGLLKAVFDVTVAGDDESVPMGERDVIQAIIREPDAATKIRMYLAHLVEEADRTMPIVLLARDAAAADPDAAEVLEQLRTEMLTAMTMFAADLAGTGQLAVPEDEARDVLWACHAPELYDLLVRQRGWGADRYRDFVAAVLVDRLVAADRAPAAASSPPRGRRRSTVPARRRS